VSEQAVLSLIKQGSEQKRAMLSLLKGSERKRAMLSLLKGSERNVTVLNKEMDSPKLFLVTDVGLYVTGPNKERQTS
jgi:hypothetical protein